MVAKAQPSLFFQRETKIRAVEPPDTRESVVQAGRFRGANPEQAKKKSRVPSNKCHGPVDQAQVGGRGQVDDD